MRALFRVFKSRWFVSLLGLALVALLIWFAGPQFAFGGWEPWASEDSRFFTIVAIFGGWGVYRLSQYLRAKATSTKVVEAILGRTAGKQPAATPQPADQEVAVLERRIQEAVAVLKKGKESRLPGRQFIYQLPWYVLIGPPGSGKTTALLSSQLRFLVTDEKGQGQELRGVHGTRDCDWFFTDEAVLLDTAGRYVTQDSREEVDSGAWLGFLQLLKSYRKRRPINGVLVCVSLPDLATQSEVQTQRESQAIRLRIRELHEHLGIRFPIYLLFTKCDLLAGFTEFFDDLSREERQQVWGMTFPVNVESSGFSELFTEEFRLLEERVNERLIGRLERERDPQRRALIYGFPQQFASMQLAAARFINDTFEPTRYELPATLRGVYFTSGTQQGTPLDRLTASLAASFGLSRQSLPSFSGQGRSYFVSRLMSDVVFNEAGLANTDAREEQRRIWLQRGVFATALILSAVVATAWAVSYFKNDRFIENISQQAAAAKTLVGEVSPNETRLVATLPALNAVRTMPGGYQDESSIVSTVSHLGLDQRPGLGAEATTTYRKLLQTLFLPRLMLRLEQRIRSASRTDELYAGLRTYLMLGSPEHFSAGDIGNWLRQDLENHDFETIDKLQREQLHAHLEVLFERGPVELPMDQDANVIQDARERLSGMSLADRIYAQIIDATNVWGGVKDFRAVDRVGSVFGYVFVADQERARDSTIDRRFTLDGYGVFKEQIRDSTQRLAKESWILGEGFGEAAADGDLARIREQVLQRYFDEYTARWDAFLNSLTVVSMDGNINKSIDVLQVLSGDNSPLKKLLSAVEHETTLERGDNLAQKGTRFAKGLLERIGDKADDLWQTPEPAGTRPVIGPAVNPVDAFFTRVNSLVRSTEGAAVPIDDTLGLLAELTGYLKSIQGVRGADLVVQVKALSDSVVGRMRQHAERQPKYLRKWLEVVEWQITQTLGARALDFLNAEWRATVWNEYQRGLRGKYPLLRSSNRDATLEDFGDFFGPGGSIDRFFQDYLNDLVDTSRRIWQVSSRSPVHISRESLVALQRASVIRDAYFASRDKNPLVKFSMKPISMDIGINDFSLDLDGQTLKFDHSATRAKALQWPGVGAAGVVNLRVSPPSAKGSSGKTIDGPWAWFRLLDGAAVARRTADRYDVTFDVDGRKIEYELRASSSLNPFKLNELERFKCPETL